MDGLTGKLFIPTWSLNAENGKGGSGWWKKNVIVLTI